MMKLMASDNDVLASLSAPNDEQKENDYEEAQEENDNDDADEKKKQAHNDGDDDVLASLSAPKQLHQTLPGCNSSGSFQKVTECS